MITASPDIPETEYQVLTVSLLLSRKNGGSLVKASDCDTLDFGFELNNSGIFLHRVINQSIRIRWLCHRKSASTRTLVISEQTDELRGTN